MKIVQLICLSIVLMWAVSTFYTDKETIKEPIYGYQLNENAMVDTARDQNSVVYAPNKMSSATPLDLTLVAADQMHPYAWRHYSPVWTKPFLIYR